MDHGSLKMIVDTIKSGHKIREIFIDLLCEEIALSATGLAMGPIPMKLPKAKRADRYGAIKKLISINEKAADYFIDYMVNGDEKKAKERSKELQEEVSKLLAGLKKDSKAYWMDKPSMN